MMPLRLLKTWPRCRIAAIVATAGCIGHTATGTRAADDLGRAPGDTNAAYFLAGMWDAINSIRSGTVTLKDGDNSATFTFDNEVSTTRYECMGQNEFGAGSCVIASPEEVIEYIVGRGVVGRHPPAYRPRSFASWPPPVDAIGLYTISEWRYRLPRERYAAETESQFKVESDGNREVVLVAEWDVYPAGRIDVKCAFTRRLWLDASQKLRPKRMQLKGTGHGVDYSIESRTVTDWQLAGGFMVPTRCAMDSVSKLQGGEPVRESSTIELEWNNVNAKLSPDCFSPRGLGAVAGDVIMDYRHEPPLREGTIGEVPRVTLSVPTSKPRTARHVVVALNVIIACSIAIAVIYRRYCVRRNT